jgi:hypothetical protein
VWDSLGREVGDGLLVVLDERLELSGIVDHVHKGLGLVHLNELRVRSGVQRPAKGASRGKRDERPRQSGQDHPGAAPPDHASELKSRYAHSRQDKAEGLFEGCKRCAISLRKKAVSVVTGTCRPAAVAGPHGGEG